MEDTDLSNLRNVIPLTQAEKEEIVGYKKGTALLISGRDKIKILTTPSTYEYENLKDKTSV